jgi:RNA polymerase sigma-70 factor (ECF subfamily)
MPTDWDRIVVFYDLLSRLDPSPIVQLNRAVAVAMRDGPVAGLVLIDALAGELADYRLFHAARADLLRRLGRVDEARTAYHAALMMTVLPAERRYIERRLREL